MFTLPDFEVEREEDDDLPEVLEGEDLDFDEPELTLFELVP